MHFQIFRTNHLPEITKKKVADFEKQASIGKDPSRILRLQVTRYKEITMQGWHALNFFL